MCGRYAVLSEQKLYTLAPWIKNARKLDDPFAGLPRYNASPMQKLPVVAVRGGNVTIQPMQWWLIPHWSKDGKIMASTFNARSENLLTGRLYAPYFKSSRCLVPADAFYEWQKLKKEAEGRKKPVETKQPWCIRRNDEKTMMLAGLFSVWKNAKGEEVPTFTILTTEPNSVMEKIHNRMPVILDEKSFEQWLDREFNDTDALTKLLKPAPAASIKAYRVSTMVSNSRNDAQACMDPIDK